MALCAVLVPPNSRPIMDHFLAKINERAFVTPVIKDDFVITDAKNLLVRSYSIDYWLGQPPNHQVDT